MSKKIIFSILLALLLYAAYVAYSVIFRADEIQEKELTSQQDQAQEVLQEKIKEVNFPVLVPSEIPEGYYLLYNQASTPISVSRDGDKIEFHYEHSRGTDIRIEQTKLSSFKEEVACSNSQEENIDTETIFLKSNVKACISFVHGRERTEESVGAPSNIQLVFYYKGIDMRVYQTNKNFKVDDENLSREEVIKFAESLLP